MAIESPSKHGIEIQEDHERNGQAMNAAEQQE
jgi:hypothetical protein